ncbi:hypothetical protein A9Q99_22265 [Gammaproteobacteria bacterium 45_16_T64]|nr:hypothetical protein A9Q99_22265 [Gammaproteobacteria bacterium 45_16_T64]
MSVTGTPEETSEPASALKNEPPLAKGLPIIGSAASLFKDPVTFLREQHKLHGQVFKFKAMHKTMTVLAGKEINRFMAGEGRDYFTSEVTWGRLRDGLKSPHLMIAVDGDAHAYQRKLLKGQFSKAAFKERMDRLVDPITTTLTSLDEGQDVHVGPFLRNIVCRQIGLAVQNVEVNTQQTEDFMTTQNTYLNVFMIGKFPRLALYMPKFALSALRTGSLLKKVREDNSNRCPVEGEEPTYMDKIEQGAKERPDLYTENDIRTISMLPFVGGVDPIGGTISFILYRLLQDDALRERVVAEVDNVYAKGALTYESVEQLQDVRGLVMETMRVNPVAYAMARTATKDFEFEGYRIKQGDELMVFTVANHWDETFFPEPETFDIERYREPRNEHKNGAIYAPFGRGPHTCIAAGLAEMHTVINVAVLLRYVDFEAAVSLDKVKVNYIPAPFMSENFKIKLTRRAIST